MLVSSVKENEKSTSNDVRDKRRRLQNDVPSVMRIKQTASCLLLCGKTVAANGCFKRHQ